MERNAIVNNSGNQTSPRTPLQESPSTFDRRGARAREYQARPPARFSSLRSDKTVNQKQQPSGNTLLAQRYLLSGNSYFWRTAKRSRALLFGQCLAYGFLEGFPAQIFAE